MEIKLLKKEFNSDTLYNDFKAGSIDKNSDYVSDETVEIMANSDFPIYLAGPNGTFDNFKEAIEVLQADYIQTDREIHLNQRFWHSLLVLYKRDYIVSNYPEVLEDKKKFDNIVLKKFDWENYIYKCVLAAEYIYDQKYENEAEATGFINAIYKNLDLYNYLIKYAIFRNSTFIINFLTVIQEEGLSDILKKQIKDRPDLGKDERYGRRVIFELNKNYPIIMAPFLEKEELKIEIQEALDLYYKNGSIEKF